jgi:hypothetical protein
MSTASIGQLSPEEFYRTSNMALVAFLKLQGHASQTVRWEGESCYWYFDKSDPLLDIVDTYMSGDALVEPREYNRVFGLTKKELATDDAPERFHHEQQRSA